ncbi:MAG: hypothetical protein K2X86_07000 [Cytophagaceae bacterium]|nr:hypothetical protein [Cytophagaceae bacterium]
MFYSAFSDCTASKTIYRRERKNSNAKAFLKMALMISVMLFIHNLHAQSGGWDASGTTGTSGYNDNGNGVIQLLNTTNTGCAGAAVHETSDKYDPASGTVFNKCYQVFFGCPNDDNIGSDQKGDGLSFSIFHTEPGYAKQRW